MIPARLPLEFRVHLEKLSGVALPKIEPTRMRRISEVYAFDPLADARWRFFVARHANSSVFHTREWLRTIQLTYGYRPVVLTTCSPNQELEDGVVFFEIDSWLTGRRMVSLPFSDHCEPLVCSEESLQVLLRSAKERCQSASQKYVEIRPLRVSIAGDEGFAATDQCYFHQIDLWPDLDEIFSSFQESSIRRKIRRAERERLVYEEGNSECLLSKFYHLMKLTRQKHRVPPQPKTWFRNLLACMGAQAKIRLACRDDQPVASILTLNFQRTMTYKYGCSDPRTNHLGGMPFLFWKAIQEAKNEGMVTLDLGRTDVDNEGLRVFKERLGGIRSTLTYARYPQEKRYLERTSASGLARRAFARMPGIVQELVGDLLYRHAG